MTSSENELCLSLCFSGQGTMFWWPHPQALVHLSLCYQKFLTSQACTCTQHLLRAPNCYATKPSCEWKLLEVCRKVLQDSLVLCCLNGKKVVDSDDNLLNCVCAGKHSKADLHTLSLFFVGGIISVFSLWLG